MTTKPSISRDLWAKILKSGSFFRRNDQWWIYFSLRPEPKFDNSKKDQKYWVLRPNFFNLDEGHFSSEGRLGPLSSQELRSEVLDFFSTLPSSSLPLTWFPHSSHEFASCFQAIQQKIADGEIKKGVPVTFLKGQGNISSWHKLHFLSRLMDAPESLMPYGFWHEQEGFIGATPEILFERSEDQFVTMALAGTQAQDFSQSTEFLNDPKERKEHDFVIKDILTQLQGMVDLVPSETQVLELPHLRHLYTPMKGRIRQAQGKNDFELTKRLHPTAALGVFPRDVGLKWMQDLPGQNERGSFGAPIVFELPKDHGLSLVGLRRLEWKGEDIRIGAGCGLVSESIFEREWIELTKKIESVKKLLGI